VQLLLLALIVGAWQRSGVSGAGQWTAPAAVVRDVRVDELWTQPALYLGAEVRFTLQFRGVKEDWEPFFSRFEPTRWLELEGWPDEQFLWDAHVFDAPRGRLFVRRGGGFEPLVRRARIYQRLEVRARVREVFQGEPWLEVLELVPREGEVGEGTILHVTRAREFAAEKSFTLALEQYERARSAPLPPHALAALLEEIRTTREARGPLEDAAEDADEDRDEDRDENKVEAGGEVDSAGGSPDRR
jgi:hypothetical protein